MINILNLKLLEFFELLFLLMILSSLSCHQTLNNQTSDNISSWLDKTNKLNNDSLVIIPNVGCGGCITNAQFYFRDNQNNKSITYIFTKIDDPRMFRQVVPKELWHNDNIVIDTADYLISLGIESIYPLLIIKNEREFKQEIFEPKIAL